MDRYGRCIDYMRVSVTDRCNLRCLYCMPRSGEAQPMSHLLQDDELVQICAAAAELGIRKLKITGGEPLVRRGCAALIARMKTLPGIEQVTMTTNGVLLARELPALMKAGLDAVNISLDSLDRARYASITGLDALPAVWDGINRALDSGLRVKLNCVLQQGLNEEELFDLAALAKDLPLDVRFIELMPIGLGKAGGGLSNTVLRERLSTRWPAMEEDPRVHGNGPAVYVRVPGWRGGIGFISAIHGKFCAGCNRIRLTAQGKVKPCLCYAESIDLRPILRAGTPETETREALGAALREAIAAKPLQHCFEDPAAVTETARMASIGG